MEKISLSVAPRVAAGKGPARQLRAKGTFPAIMYGLGQNTSITINRKEFARILNSGVGSAALLAVKVEGEDSEHLVIIRDYQVDPIKSEILHADLMEVALDKVIHVNVPVALVGVCKGVKDGGLFQHPTRDIDIECLPDRIPDHIFVDITALKIGESVHVGDLKLPEGVRALAEAEQVVVSVAAPISEEQLDKMLSSEKAESKEPEVLKAKKAEEGK